MNKTSANCPFCAYMGEHIRLASEIVELPAGVRAYEYYCWCPNCGAKGPNMSTISDAYRLWNMRRKEYPGGKNG